MIRVAVAVVMVLGLGACGGGSSGSRPRAPAPRSGPRPDCDQFCVQAGPSGGPNPEACPQASGVCPSCPPEGCLDVLSTSAQVDANGVATVQVRCKLSKPCEGAFLILPPDMPTRPDASPLPPSERIAGSSFTLSAGRTSGVRVALSAMGQKLARASGGYEGAAWILLKGYGFVPAGDQPRIRLSG